MKILSIKTGFVTNSSSDNFWFVVLERTKHAREEMARQIAEKRKLPVDKILKAIETSLKKEAYMYDGEYEGYGGTPCGLYVNYSLNFKKLAEADNKVMSSLVREIGRIIKRCIHEERVMEDADLDISKFSGIIVPKRKSVAKSYKELLNVAKTLSDDALTRLLTNIIILSKEGLFRNERCALTKALMTLIKDVVESKDMRIFVTYMAVGQGEFAYFPSASALGYDDVDIENLENFGRGILGVYDNSLLIVEKGGGLHNKPVLADLKDTDNFAVEHFRGIWMPLRVLMRFLKRNGLMEDLVKEIAERVKKGDPAARIAAVILKLQKVYVLGYYSETKWEYT
ncbi:MAG: hypothetical protein QXZ02_03370 [Candidatus Bathyarchaeia archaeon]